MARRAADVALDRPARIEEQYLPESLLSRRGWNFGVQCLRQRTKQRLGLLEKRGIILGIEHLEAGAEERSTKHDHNRHSSTLHTSPFLYGFRESVILPPSCPCLRNS